MARIPSINDSIKGDIESYGDSVEQFVYENGSRYEEAFSGFLMSYVKDDPILKNFYIRFVFECEIIKIVIDKQTKINLSRLEMLVDNMETAPNTEILAVYDSQFHQELFDIADREEFFDWFRLQSKDLSTFLSGFWKAIGYGTDYYHELLIIHKEIFNAVKEKNKDKAVEMMERHFSILLFQLLGTMFSQRKN
ncbi:FCD domain-containing protein [Butyrivibrio sp. AE2032]|jgi:Transcriptional regulators|uniref:FCD domain-containing protein n=1 Tax=Butyrivibrio sp. AE2032 TaxID=1458463 RepID=UPI000557E006|nr:FCD domain-containing protein [Butyrivibrio sp. AE2032]